MNALDSMDTLQLVALGFLIVGPAGEHILPGTVQIGIVLLWISAILTLIAENLGGRCLPRAYNRNSANIVNCSVLEELPAGMTCADVASMGRDGTAVRPVQDSLRAPASAASVAGR